MDFLSLQTEYDTYKEYIEKADNSMNYLSEFFSSFQKGLNDYATNIQKILNNTVTNLIKFDNKSTYMKKFFTVMRLFETHLLKLIFISKKIFSEIVQPMNDFSKYIISDNNIKLNELRKIMNETSFAKKKYENIKKEYLLACRNAAEQEKVLLREMDNMKDNNNKNEINLNITNQNDFLTQLRVNSQLLCEKYKEEYKGINEIYEINNKKYFPIINNLKDNEEKRINFLFFNLEKFISYLTEKNNSLNEFINNLKQEDTNKNFMKVKLEEDMKNYKEKFNFCKKQNIRFIKEDLFLYEIHRKNIDLIIKNPNYLNSPNTLNAINNINNINNNLLPYTSYNHNVFNFETVKVQLNYDDQIIFNNLFDGNGNNPNLENKKFSSFKKRLIEDIKFSEEIIDKMLGEVFQRPIYYEFKNLEKFECVKQILIDISMNKEVRTNIMEMNYGIIFIAEKGFYYDKNINEKKYLSKEMVKEDNNFKNKYFWKKLLDNKIYSSLKKVYKTEEDKANSNKIKEDNIKKGDLIKKELMNIIKDYIVHFTNFNLAITDINDIIIDLKSNFSLNDNEISYLICFLNSNTYNIRSKYHKDEKNSLFTKKIKTTKNKKYKQILLSLNSCFMFLKSQDFINIKNLNKTYYKQIEKLIYKQIFIKDNKNFLKSRIDLSNREKHFEMWFNYLKYDKNKINYLTKSTEAKQAKNLDNVLDIIQLDVIRTHFDTDKENKRKIIKNVLITLAYTYPEVSYCQGMNYISSFLLEVTNNEEKSFDLFSAILNKTEYSKLSINDFELMKKYFYVFERLICIYLPELYTTFKRNNINANFFISPWFITLFTHSYSGNNAKILMRIFDLFILDGWLAIIRIGLILLKQYQDDLFSMEFEELLHFLINELKEKYDFFNDNNYEKFIELYNEIKLPKGLVNNLENEFELNKKIIYN